MAQVNTFGNIHQHLDLIAGLPYEDIESFHRSFNDVYKMEPEQLQLGFLKVLKGSLLAFLSLLIWDLCPLAIGETSFQA